MKLKLFHKSSLKLKLLHVVSKWSSNINYNTLVNEAQTFYKSQISEAQTPTQILIRGAQTSLFIT